MSQFYIKSSGGGGGSDVLTLTGNSGGSVGPNVGGNINVVGSGGVSVAGNAGTNTLTITATSGVLNWTDEATSFGALANNGYFLTAALTMTLPGSPSQGNIIQVAVDSISPITITCTNNQFIQFADSSTLMNGSITNLAYGDTVTLVFRASDNKWLVISSQGSWTVT